MPAKKDDKSKKTNSGTGNQKQSELGRGGGGVGPVGPQTEESFIVCHVSGDVTLVREGSSSPMKEFEHGSLGIALRDGDRIITGANGYAWNIMSGSRNEASSSEDDISLTMFPKSEAVLRIRTPTKKSGKSTIIRHIIEKVEPARGYFCLGITINGNGKFWDRFVLPAAYQSVEVKPIFGEFKKQKSFAAYVELAPDGSLVFSHMANRIIYNGIEPQERIGSIGGRITLKNGAMYVSKKPDQRDAETTNRLPLMFQITATYAVKRELDNGTIDAAIDAAKNAGSSETYEKYIKQLEQGVKEAEETEDDYIIQLAKNQLQVARETKTRAQYAADAAELLAVLEKRKQDAEKMVARLPSLLNQLQQPLPAYSPPVDSERVVIRTDIARKAKTYEQILDEQQRLADELEKKAAGKGFSGTTPDKLLAQASGTIDLREKMKKDVMTLMTTEGLSEVIKTIDLDGKFGYQRGGYVIFKAEKGTMMKMQRATPGKLFVTVFMRVNNPMTSTLFLDPDAAYHIVADGAEIAPMNYFIKTDVDPGKTLEGYVLFVVPEDAKSLVFRCGRKGEAKSEVPLTF